MHKNKKKYVKNIIYMRLFIGLLLIALLVPAIFTLVQMGVFSDEPQIEIEAKETSDDAPVLKIATDYDFCPNSYINGDGKLSGLYIELATEVANRLGMKPEFKTGEWLECRKMLTDKEADVLLGLEIFSNMEGTLRTIPICSDELRVYSKYPIDSAAALAGKKVALMARSVIAATYDLQCEYLEYYTNTEILQAVESGEADYGICHGAVAAKIIEKNKFHLQASLPIAKSYPAMAVDDSHPDLQMKLNKVLQEMSIDGTIGKLEKKWITEFTKNKSFDYVLKNNEVFYLTFLFSMLVLICICIAFWIMDVKRNEYIQSLLDYQVKLKHLTQEAMKANRTKSEFLSHMSHDLRTPMNGIMGMIERIRKKKDDPKLVEDCVNKIDIASNHLLSLLNDVLDMSELEQGSVELEQKPFDLNEELKNVQVISEELNNEKNVIVEISVEAVHTKLVGSTLHLRRILLNLISNAIKYNKPNGRVDVIVRELESDTERAKYQLIVKDTGIGMSEEFIEQSLYKPFTQENDNVRTKYQGTGLGMAIVSRLVKAMDGTIQVESIQGVGTTFTIELTFGIDSNLHSDTDKIEEIADVSGMCVLVAEDNELNREIVQCTLEDMDVEVVSAENGENAVDIFKDSPIGKFDAILMDIMMPILDGVEATKKIRALDRPDAKSVAIIAMTANAFEQDKKKTREAGMNEHLAKPIDEKKLRGILRKYKAKN